MPKVSVTKQFRFEAAHFLPNYSGLCKNIHGHSYLLEVMIESGSEGIWGNRYSVNPVESMVIDFSELKVIVKHEIIDKLDHSDLNNPDLEEIQFPYWMPTAENMVIWVWKRLKPQLQGLKKIRLWETVSSYAEIYE